MSDIDYQLTPRQKTKTPASTRSSQTVDNINQQMNNNAAGILNGKKGDIGSHDAATLSDHITNNLNTVTGELDSAISAQKGLSEQQLATTRAFMNKSNSIEELEDLISRMNSSKPIKKSNAARKLISDMQAKVDMLKAKQITTSSAQTNAPKVEAYKAPTPTNEGRTADFAAVQRNMIARRIQEK